MGRSPRYYRLIGKLAVPSANLEAWVSDMMRHGVDRLFPTVGKTQAGVYFVSTIFLGFDHQPIDGGPPLLFETMLFDEAGQCYQDRSSTWAAAEEMHERAVALARDLSNNGENRLSAFIERWQKERPGQSV